MTHRIFFACLATAGFLAVAQTPPAPVPNPVADSSTHSRARTSGSAPKNVAWDALEKGLQDADTEHRKKALAAFGTLGDSPRALELVEKTLKDDKDTLVRQRAAAALGEMGSRDAIPALKAALDDGPEVSFTAAKSLWDLGDSDDSQDIFVQVIAGERKDTPSKLHGAIRDAKKKLRPSELALMGAKEAAGLLGPASMGIDAVQEALKEAKKGSGSPGRVVAAGILAKDSDPYALAMLEWAVGDDSASVRVAVAKALGSRGNEGTIPKLVPLLSDDRHEVRYMAAASLIKLDLKYHRE